MGIVHLLRARYLDVLASVYLHNEFRGFAGLDRLHVAISNKYPHEPVLLAAVAKHAADERKHYLLFRRYFETAGRMPLAVAPSCGYVDQLVARIFGCAVENLDERAVLDDPQRFFVLCRAIMMTERRGLAQVKALLRSRIVKEDARLVNIFRVVEMDEPSHCLPYEEWLRDRGGDLPGWRERLADAAVHYSLVLGRLPAMLMNPRVPRLRTFPA